MFKYYTSNIGVIFKEATTGYSSRTIDQFGITQIDDVPISEIKALGNGWYLHKGEFKKFKRMLPSKSVQVGFGICQRALISDKLPEFIKLSDVVRGEDDWDTYFYKGIEITDLYEPVTEITQRVEEEFEPKNHFIRHVEITNYESPQQMEIKLANEVGKTTTANIANIVRYSDLEQMLTPEFLLHDRPCKIDSATVYKIVRGHILENIDYKQARITSNYDFCFTVKKVVHTQPFERIVYNISGKNKSTQKKITATEKEVEVFEMTWAGYKGASGYDGYTCIPEWSANSLKEMCDQVKDYLDKLIEMINSDLHQCEHCNGYGAVVNKIGTANRNL